MSAWVTADPVLPSANLKDVTFLGQSKGNHVDRLIAGPSVSPHSPSH